MDVDYLYGWSSEHEAAWRRTWTNDIFVPTQKEYTNDIFVQDVDIETNLDNGVIAKWPDGHESNIAAMPAKIFVAKQAAWEQQQVMKKPSARGTDSAGKNGGNDEKSGTDKKGGNAKKGDNDKKGEQEDNGGGEGTMLVKGKPDRHPIFVIFLGSRSV